MGEEKELVYGASGKPARGTKVRIKELRIAVGVLTGFSSSPQGEKLAMWIVTHSWLTKQLRASGISGRR